MPQKQGRQEGRDGEGRKGIRRAGRQSHEGTTQHESVQKAGESPLPANESEILQQVSPSPSRSKPTTHTCHVSMFGERV